MSDHHVMESEGPWPAGWVWSLVAAVVAAILARWLGGVSVAAAILLGLMVFAVYAVLLAQFWEAPASGDHDHGHGHDGHAHDEHSHGDHAQGHAHPAPLAAPSVAATPMAAPTIVAPAAPVIAAPPVAPPAPAAPLMAAIPATAGAPTRPAALTAPRGGKADNLQEIEGIGPALEKLAHEMGIFHFDQIAAWGAAETEWMDGNLKGFKGRVTRDKWVAQAKIIVTEGVEAFRLRAKTNDY